MGGGSTESVPLQNHPVFTNRSASTTTTTTAIVSASSTGGGSPSAGGVAGNLAAWDAASSRLYLWDPHGRHLHRISVRFSDDGSGGGGSEHPILLEAAAPSEILMPDTSFKSKIHSISLNNDGSSMLFIGDEVIIVMNLRERTSSNGKVVTYRTSKVGSEIFTADNKGLRTLQVSWHPNSNSHIGILSSDSILRLFDLSSDLEQAEQEYYLQPVETGSGHNAASICPVAFSFGDQHYWDRFSVFILFSDGSTYVLCPVIPFGSVFSWAFLEELREDANAFGMKSSSENAIGSSKLALNWLESTFPELADLSTVEGNKLLLKAHPYAPVDASLMLQGPLGKAHSSNGNKDFRVWNADCGGKALSSLYISIGKDSVLLTAWSGGQLQIDALADEIQPLWNLGSPPRLHINSFGQIKGIAMICESKVQFSSNKSISSSDTVYNGPPLLRLAIVDLALPSYALTSCLLALYSDPLVSERFYCLHGGGLDSICLNFLPFSDTHSGTDNIGKEPSVVPVLTTGHGESCSSMALCGFVTIADTCGHTQLVGLTPSYECVVVDSRDITEVTPLHYNMDEQPLGSLENDSHEVINKDLLGGPKAIVVSSSEALRGLTADSVDGRKALHRYVNLFHENYVKYAHKVAVELEHHDKYLTVTVDDQLKRLCDVNQLLSNLEHKQQSNCDRISRAFKVYELLEQRLQNFRKLPRANKKPLSRAEQELKAQLERFADVELDALRSSIEALNGRLKRYQSSLNSSPNVPRQSPGRKKALVSDSQMVQIKSTLELLSDVNNENTKKIDLIEHGLKRHKEKL